MVHTFMKLFLGCELHYNLLDWSLWVMMEIVWLNWEVYSVQHPISWVLG